MKRTAHVMLGVLFVLLAFPMSPSRAVGEENVTPKPNVLFIFTDDQRSDTIAALGNPHIVTPNLDRLAARSFVFRNAYCFGGNTGAVCIPSRNMTMTGRVFFRFPRGASRADPAWPNFPKSMKAAGYETYYDEKSGAANLHKIRLQFDHHRDTNMVAVLKTGRPARKVVDDAIEFLQDGRDRTRPFFMYLGLPCPHDPRWSTQRFRDWYDPETLPLPPNYQPVHALDIGDMMIRDECLEAWPRTPDAIRRHLHDYYALISSMDFDIGRLLDALDTLSLADETLVIFSSDQGIALGSHGLMGKQNVYEDTLRVPLLLAGPGIPQGESNALVYLHDIFPTVCEFAGASVPDDLDGTSFMPVIRGKADQVRPTLLLAYRNFQRSIRDTRWKLIRFPQINRTLLFDLENDPRETINLAADATHREVVERLTRQMAREQQRYDDRVPLESTSPQPAEFIPPEKKLRTAYPAGGLAPLAEGG